VRASIFTSSDLLASAAIAGLLAGDVKQRDQRFGHGGVFAGPLLLTAGGGGTAGSGRLQAPAGSTMVTATMLISICLLRFIGVAPSAAYAPLQRKSAKTEPPSI
jgi:hypothetical protein